MGFLGLDSPTSPPWVTCWFVPCCFAATGGLRHGKVPGIRFSPRFARLSCSNMVVLAMGGDSSFRPVSSRFCRSVPFSCRHLPDAMTDDDVDDSFATGCRAREGSSRGAGSCTPGSRSVEARGVFRRGGSETSSVRSSRTDTKAP